MVYPSNSDGKCTNKHISCPADVNTHIQMKLELKYYNRIRICKWIYFALTFPHSSFLKGRLSFRPFCFLPFLRILLQRTLEKTNWVFLQILNIEFLGKNSPRRCDLSVEWVGWWGSLLNVKEAAQEKHLSTKLAYCYIFRLQQRNEGKTDTCSIHFKWDYLIRTLS